MQKKKNTKKRKILRFHLDLFLHGCEYICGADPECCERVWSIPKAASPFAP